MTGTGDSPTGRGTAFRNDLLQERGVLVSGGGSGIGQTIALTCAELGADVAVCGRRIEPLEETCEQIERLGVRGLAVSTDIRVPDQVDALFERVHARFGRLDVLVNNAGGQFPAHATDISDRGWRAVVDTNLNGTWTMMQRAARGWRDAGQAGAIVNIVAPYARGMYGVAHTVAARAGVVAASRNVAVEWAPYRIRVNCVLPGPIESRGLEVYDSAVRSRMKDTLPLQTLGDARDVADAVVYLAADSGRFVTGEVLTVDGGLHLHGALWLAGRPEGWRSNTEG